METVSNAAAAVKNAIWGTGENPDDPQSNETGGQEPLSGEMGKGTPNEPYDKGNQEHSASTTNTTSSSDSPASTSKDMSVAPTSNPAATRPGPESQSRPDAGDHPGDVRPTEANENRPNVNAGGFGTAEPNTSADPSSGQKPEQKQQGADRPESEPSATESAAVADKKKEGEAAAASDGQTIESEDQRQELAAQGKLPHDPDDHSGEPMKMHGGKEGTEDKSDDPRQEAQEKNDRSKSVGQEGGHPHGKPKGTGEQYVKSSGLAADGGDFDATKPGAGREATRLMEEKGIHKHTPAEQQAGAEESSSKSSGGAKDSGTPGKESKMQKLKDKLHIGTGKNLSS